MLTEGKMKTNVKQRPKVVKRPIGPPPAPIPRNQQIVPVPRAFSFDCHGCEHITRSARIDPCRTCLKKTYGRGYEEE